MVKKRFIKKAVTRKGALRIQLNIPKDRNIPMPLLDRIINSKPGVIVNNPTRTGNRKIKVTRLLKKRAVLGRNLKRLPKK